VFCLGKNAREKWWLKSPKMAKNWAFPRVFVPFLSHKRAPKSDFSLASGRAVYRANFIVIEIQ
jgi:hypothetical protein